MLLVCVHTVYVCVWGGGGVLSFTIYHYCVLCVTMCVCSQCITVCLSVCVCVCREASPSWPSCGTARASVSSLRRASTRSRWGECSRSRPRPPTQPTRARSQAWAGSQVTPTSKDPSLKPHLWTPSSPQHQAISSHPPTKLPHHPLA